MGENKSKHKCLWTSVLKRTSLGKKMFVDIVERLQMCKVTYKTIMPYALVHHTQSFVTGIEILP